MRTFSVDFRAELNKSPLTLARIFELTLIDGTVYRWTDHDISLVYSGQSFSASNAVSISAVESTTGAISTNTEATIKYVGGLTRDQFLAGLMDNATFKAWVVSWSNVNAGRTPLINGVLQRKSVDDRQAGTWTVKGLLRYTDGFLGEQYSPECRNMLGDLHCTKSLVAFTETFTVTTVLDSYSQFNANISAARVEDFFNLGFVKFTADTFPVEVLDYHIISGVSVRVTLAIPRMFTTIVGDTGIIVAGCDKRLLTCLGTFDNVVNFRGEPFNPTDDALTGASV